MKRKLQINITTFAASLMAFSAIAQVTPDRKADGREINRDLMSQTRRADRLHGAAKASDLIGMTVNNYQNEKLGKVDDIAVDVESGRIVQVILSTGGFIGIGDTLTAIPPGALHHDTAQKVLHLDANQEKMKGAPRFESSKWAEGSDSNHLSAVYNYYGEEPSFRFIHRGDSVLDGLRAPDGQINKEGQRNPNVVNNPVGQPNRDNETTIVSDRTRDEAWEKNRASRERQSMIPMSRLDNVQKASKLMGASIKNLQDEKIGRIENLLMDLTSGRIVAVIVSTGGFLGIGDELSALPPTALRFNEDRDALQLDASKEMLGSAPHFKNDQWPDFSQPTYSEGVYRAYKVEPYFTTNAAPDNTARNVRDRDDRSLTPLNQGSSKADVETTAQIRKEIMAGKNMSVNAKNVKIITNNGKVTLRGPVNTAEEKRLIGEIASRVARSENVDNQLDATNAAVTDK